jgi:NAD(P)-dependent dehydrogenase (short-subunit alcohol dehydrogenase family)
METVKLPQSALMEALQNRPKHVMVTGASRGIGEAVARLFGENGARLSLAARSYNKLLGVAMDVGTDRAQALRLDLADEKSIDEAVVAAESRFGPIDVLICNAGTHDDTPVDDVSAEGRARFRQIIDVNVIGTYYLAQLAAQHMPSGGRIIFVGSVLARFGVPRASAYVASKHAVLGLTRAMAAELAPRNIRVNAINPGWVDTKMAQQVTAEQLKNQPLRRMIKPDEVAAYVQFLAGPGGDAITGQGVDISCGSVMV